MDKSRSRHQDTDSERSYKKENQKLKEANRALKKQVERLRKELKRLNSTMSDVEDVIEDEIEQTFTPHTVKKPQDRFCPKCQHESTVFFVNSPSGRIYIERCSSCNYKKRVRSEDSA